MRKIEIVRVEILDENLRRHYGPYKHMGIANALKGEAKGLWRIRRDEYEATVMHAAPPASYEVKEVIDGEEREVCWVEDGCDPPGGAELSSMRLRQIGQALGFKIAVINPGSDIRPLDRAKIAVVGNFHRFAQKQRQAILEKLLECKLPYVKYEHDHRELARPQFARSLFNGALFNIFLSPIHLKNHDAIRSPRSLALPLAIDPTPFLVAEGERRPGTALVCNVRHFKTWHKLQSYIDEHPEIRFTVLSGTKCVQGGNVELKPKVPHELMPQLYASHEYLVHLLDGWGAGERVIFEAALAGCKVVSDERAGHMSWGYNLDDREGLAKTLRQAPFDFWRLIDAALRSTELLDEEIRRVRQIYGGAAQPAR